MPGWYYDKKEIKNSPSAQDGIDYDTEMRYRKEGARFIISIGSKMGLGYNTIATGVVYFHRFYMFHSFREFPRYVTACCCLFLAGKVEETPKKCKDIIKTARELLPDEKFITFGEDPKEEVMTLERILLQTIKFDLQVEHPYSYLLKYAKCLKGDKAKLQKVVQKAWIFVNDSLCTTLALQWEPEIIAVALIYLAGKFSAFEVLDWSGRVPKHLRWWDVFVEDVTMDLLEDICHQVLDSYSNQPKTSIPDSPPPGSRQQNPSVTIKKSNGQDKIDLQESAKLNTQIPPPSDIPPYQYQTFTTGPYTPVYSTPIPVVAPPHMGGAQMGGPSQHMGGPPPHMGGPPPPQIGGPPPQIGGPLPQMGGPLAQMGGPPPHMGGPPIHISTAHASSGFPPYVGRPPPFSPTVPPPNSFYQQPAPISNQRPYYPPT